MPATICSMIARGSSLRGLSLVTSTWSAAWAMRPICGRLPGSRSPPQPNTHHSWPPRSCATGRSARGLFQRVRRVRVVDHDQRRILAADLLHAARGRHQRFDRVQRRAQFDALGQQHAQHRQRIAGVEVADHARARQGAAERRLELEFGAGRAAAQVRGAQDRHAVDIGCS
jgi:hypothetical protein